MSILDDHKKILFIHIPKTAGSSITKILQKNNLDNWKREKILNHHDPLFLIERNNDLSNTFKFSIVRNPYKRAFSHYKHIVQTRNVVMTFYDYLMYVRLNGNIRLYDSKYASSFIERLPLLSYTQSFYLHDTIGNFSIDKIYRMEQFDEIEKDFGLKLPKENVGAYSHTEYLNNYDLRIKSLVKYIYSYDFDLFNYSTHFDDSI